MIGALLDPYAFTGALMDSTAFDAGCLVAALGPLTPKAKTASAITAVAALAHRLTGCANLVSFGKRKRQLNFASPIEFAPSGAYCNANRIAFSRCLSVHSNPAIVPAIMDHRKPSLLGCG